MLFLEQAEGRGEVPSRFDFTSQLWMILFPSVQWLRFEAALKDSEKKERWGLEMKDAPAVKEH